MIIKIATFAFLLNFHKILLPYRLLFACSSYTEKKRKSIQRKKKNGSRIHGLINQKKLAKVDKISWQRGAKSNPRETGVEERIYRTMTLNLRAVPWQRFLAALSNYPLARLPASLLFSFARGTCNIFHRGGSSPEDIINSRAGISPLAVASDSQVPPGLSSLLFSLASSSATLVLRLGRSPAAVSGRLSSSFRGRKRRKRGARREI